MTDPPIGLGIDIGGTGIKAALVDLAAGALASERLQADTPQPATIEALPVAVADLVRPLIEAEQAIEAVGIGFPAVVRRGVALSAVNVADGWLYADLGRIFGDALGRPIWALNDSDAAGLAEARFGAGRHRDGTVVVTTLGTGVGTSLIVEGRLVPNVELGLLDVRGKPAGRRVANSVRVKKRLSWRRWAADLERFINVLDEAVAPDLVIIGGGVSNEAHRFLPYLKTRPLVLPARLRNDAGIVGAAVFAMDQQRVRSAASRNGTEAVDPLAVTSQ